MQIQIWTQIKTLRACPLSDFGSVSPPPSLSPSLAYSLSHALSHTHTALAHTHTHLHTCRYVHKYHALLAQTLRNLRFQVRRVDSVVASHGAIPSNQNYTNPNKREGGEFSEIREVFRDPKSARIIHHIQKCGNLS